MVSTRKLREIRSEKLTALSNRFARVIATKLIDAKAIGDRVVVGPTRHILRGLSLERTPNKDAFYLWLIVVPLYGMMIKSITLNYSMRISLNEELPGPINIGADSDELALQISDVFIKKHTQYCERVSEPLGFLNEFEPKGDFCRPNIALDFAISHCLAGDFEKGKMRLQEILLLTADTPILPLVHETARNVLRSLHSSQDAFFELIRSVEGEKINNHFPGLITIG